MKSVLKPRKMPKQERSQVMVDTLLEATARVLAKRGYAGTNTNLIAETAGVSVGSIYQYYPNKDSLIAALHKRHALQMRNMIIRVLSGSKNETLREAVKALVRALLEAHSIEPQLHRVFEVEFPLDLRKGDYPFSQDISKLVHELLENHRREIRQSDLDLAVYIVLNIIKLLVHQAILEPPSHFPLSSIENAISEAVLAYLTLPVSRIDS